MQNCSIDTLKRRVLAAKGEIKFDTLFYNARFVDVYTERVIENASVGVIDGFVASLCPQFKAQAEEYVDCKNMYLVPALIDAHMHIESTKLSPHAYCEGAVPHGTGCLLFDPMQLVNACGYEGIKAFCQMLEELPVEAFLQFPSSVPTFGVLGTAGARFSPQQTLELIRHSATVSLGEVDAARVADDELLQKLCGAAEMGLVINGHCPEMDSDGINAAAAAGLCDDHECTDAKGLVSRLSRGMAVFIREGTLEPNCEPLIKAVTRLGLPTDSLMFCTDDKSPADILENGCIDNCVRIAIAAGMPPITAVKLATLNAARHFHIDGIVGSCTPGRRADFLLLPELCRFEISRVYHGGRLVAADGRLLSKPQLDLSAYPALKNMITLPKGLCEKNLLPTLPEGCTAVTVEVMEMPRGGILTKRSRARLKVSGQKLILDPECDILPIAVIERYAKSGGIGIGFIKGLKIKRGALAVSAAQEGNNIAVSGTAAEDMLGAVKAVEAMGGGAAVCIDGVITARHEYPIAGILSARDIEGEIAADRDFKEKLLQLGSENDRLLSTLIVAPCSTIPELGLTDRGLVDVAAKRIIPCIVEYETE